jgi:hypothetical protein
MFEETGRDTSKPDAPPGGKSLIRLIFEEERIMFKLISFAAVVGLVMLTVTQDASAGWRRRCRHDETYYAPAAPAVTMAPAASAPAAGAPAVAQSGSGSSYRSYSYDSGTAPAYQVPAPYMSRQPARAPSESNFFRADRKMHGLSWYRNP